MLSNPVVISIAVLLALSLLRLNVIIALVISALTAGLGGGLGLTKTIETFTGGLGGGAEVAMNYACLLYTSPGPKAENLLAHVDFSTGVETSLIKCSLIN